MSRIRKLLVLLVVVSVSMLTVFSSQNAFAKQAKKAQDKQEQDKKEEMVYATSQGKKYHKEGCRFIKNREAQAISKKEAEEKGLVACGKCYKENTTAEEEVTAEEKE